MSSATVLSDPYEPAERAGDRDAVASGVSWTAVIAGAFAMAAMALILLALGAGLGLSSVSPWSNQGASASAIKSSAVVWLIVTEICSASLGGYLAGRLRTRWTRVHTDEVYFRDTAHGFLAWCAALVFTAAFLASAASVMIGSSSSSQDNRGGTDRTNAYFIDSLFRGANASTPATPAVLDEAGIIFARSLREGSMSADDQTYLSQVVSEKTGMTTADSQRRVSETFLRTQQALEVSRKALAHTLLWTFLALLIGAFCGSFFATIGGRQRDRVVMI